MVTSASMEPTESEVVLNLAAAYAEAGERVLVVSTTDLRSNRPMSPAAFQADPSAESVHAPQVHVAAGGIPESPTQPLPVVTAGAPAIGSDPPTDRVSAVGSAPSNGAPEPRRAVTVDELVGALRSPTGLRGVEAPARRVASRAGELAHSRECDRLDRTPDSRRRDRGAHRQYFRRPTQRLLSDASTPWW